MVLDNTRQIASLDESTLILLTQNIQESSWWTWHSGQPTVSPSVQVFAPSQEEIRSPNPYTVVCLLTDFYPAAFNLQWKGGADVISSGVETTKASRQGDKYLASSYLKLTAAQYEKYESFTCEVTHESKKISKTVSKSGSC
uniref:Ig-like domain-containing protein n=1 Tax=Naja naja TaxID=35670 RepID=A0A8C6X495_NAJNA